MKRQFSLLCSFSNAGEYSVKATGILLVTKQKHEWNEGMYSSQVFRLSYQPVKTRLNGSTCLLIQTDLCAFLFSCVYFVWDQVGASWSACSENLRNTPQSWSVYSINFKGAVAAVLPTNAFSYSFRIRIFFLPIVLCCQQRAFPRNVEFERSVKGE